MPSLAEDLTLLLLDDESGRSVVDRVALDNALAGAVLLELAHLGRIGASGDTTSVKLSVRDSSTTGDRVLDLALNRLEGKEFKGKRGVQLLVKGTRETVLDALVNRGILRHEETKILGIFPRQSWPANDTQHESAIRRQLTDALGGAAVPDAHTAGLIVLLNAVDAVHKVVDGDKKQLRTQAKAIAEGEAKWASEAVRKAVESVRTAVNTAVIAAAAAGSGGASS